MKDFFGRDFEQGAIYAYQTNFATNLAVFASEESSRDVVAINPKWAVVFPFCWWDVRGSSIYRGIKSNVLNHKLIKVDHNLLTEEQLKEANYQRKSRLNLPPLVKSN